ncbi:hypothetical protein GWI33_004793 [Rhynchophorus ferrugineus]|uniref:Odorant receptor n=1 Tax=Rhynchophorus ferrugineus TaxID=354439 RepID=A0A834MED4_RHYFE|nr:hypothetical protein GWI33_004793 [Rhynchophorus ferrugineus]
MTAFEEKENAASPRQCTVSQVDWFLELMEEDYHLNFEMDDEGLSTYDHMYQAHIYSNLVDIYHYQFEMLRIVRECTESLTLKIVGGLILLFGGDIWLICIAIIFIYALSVTVLFNSCEICENLQTEFYNSLCNMTWFFWNQQNKRIYLFMLMNSQQAIHLYISFNVPVNRKSLLLYIRNTYGFLNFLYQLNISGGPF